MKLTRQQIKALSEYIVAELARLKLVRPLLPDEEAVAMVERAVTEDLSAEDRLNDEVKDILKNYQKEIEQGRVDYKTMFDMVKKELVKKRGIVI